MMRDVTGKIVGSLRLYPQRLVREIALLALSECHRRQ